MELLSLIKEILFIRPGHALAILRSWLWIFFHPRFLHQRRQNLKKTHNIDNIYQKSIVVEYFLKWKKTYKEL